MLLVTMDNLPENFEIHKIYRLIQSTTTIQVSKKTVIQRIRDKERNDYEEALDLLKNKAPKEANAIIGVRLSISTQAFSNGTFLYYSLIGTPVEYHIKGDSSDVKQPFS